MNNSYSNDFKGWLCMQFGLGFDEIQVKISSKILQDYCNIFETTKMLLNPSTPNQAFCFSHYRHEKSGDTYTLICISNSTAVQNEYIESAVYINGSGEIFSRPLDQFRSKFTKLAGQNN